MNKFLRLLAVTGLGMGLILCLAYIAHAQAKPDKPVKAAQYSGTDTGVSPAGPVALPEVSKLRLIVAYQKAVMAKAQFDAAAASYTGLADQEIKANGYEEGTRFDVNLEAQQVLVISPPKKPEAVKPAEPAVKK